MKCSRCSAEVSDASALCPHCGANLRPGQPATFSYLPAGAPPWPTSVPLQLPHLVDALPAQSKPLADQATNQPRRSAASVIALISILVLTPILGVLITLGVLYGQGQFNQAPKASHLAQSHSALATPTAVPNQGNQLPTPTSFKTVQDTTLNLSLQYPADWTAGPLDQSSDPMDYPIKAADTSGSTTILVDLQRFSESVSAKITSADSLNTSAIGALAQNSKVTNVQNGATTQPTIAGTKWSQQEATFVDSANVKVHLSTITVQRNKVYYRINIFMPETLYQEALQKDLQPMLDSVQFLS